MLGEVTKIQNQVGEALRTSKKRTIGKIVQALNEHCQLPNVWFHQQKVEKLSDMVLIAGYCQYARRNADIDIYLQYSDASVSFTTPSNQDFPIRVVATLLHELTHKKQFGKWCGRSINHADSDLKTYLAAHIEIDAFALEIAYELWIRNIASVLRNIDDIDPYSCPHLTEYRIEFGKDHPVYRKLLKKIVQNLSELGVDKF